MSIDKLAALVAVRNHIFTVINDRAITEKGDFAILNQKRIALDKKFVEILKGVDVEKIFSGNSESGITLTEQPFVVWTPIKETSQENQEDPRLAGLVKYSSSEEDRLALDQLALPFKDPTVKITPSVVVDNTTPILAPQKAIKAPKEPVEDSDVAAVIKREKKLLAEQGRSNKRIAKTNDKG